MDPRQIEDNRQTIDYEQFQNQENDEDYSRRFSLHYAGGNNPNNNDGQCMLLFTSLLILVSSLEFV
jgi:hypothetical protein